MQEIPSIRLILTSRGQIINKMSRENRDNENAQSDEKEDIHFLKTMMPFVKQVQSRKKLNLRNDLNQLVQGYVYPDPPSVKAEKRKRKSAFVGGNYFQFL